MIKKRFFVLVIVGLTSLYGCGKPAVVSPVASSAAPTAPEKTAPAKPSANDIVNKGIEAEPLSSPPIMHSY